MRNPLKAAWKRLTRIPRRLSAARNVAGLQPVCPPLANALSAVTKRFLEAEESAWVQKIEALRAEMEACSDRIEIIDYGAGAPGLELTPEEVAHGRSETATVGEICRSASKPPFWSLLLFRLVREFKPVACLELGTCLGVSASYISAGLAQNGRGRIVSLEGAEALAERARRNFSRLRLGQAAVVTGRFQDTLPSVLREHGPFDFAFIDGHHEEAATLRYFAALLPALSRPALLVFDDIRWSPGMKRAWRAICADSRLALVVDLGVMGVALAADTMPGRRIFSIPLD